MEVLKTMPFQVSEKIVELVNLDNKLQKQLNEQRKASHKALWDAVHNEYPELDEDANYSLRCEFAEQGIVMLETGDDSHPGRKLAQALGRMIKDVN